MNLNAIRADFEFLGKMRDRRIVHKNFLACG